MLNASRKHIHTQRENYKESAMSGSEQVNATKFTHTTCAFCNLLYINVSP